MGGGMVWKKNQIDVTRKQTLFILERGKVVVEDNSVTYKLFILLLLLLLLTWS